MEKLSGSTLQEAFQNMNAAPPGAEPLQPTPPVTPPAEPPAPPVQTTPLQKEGEKPQPTPTATLPKDDNTATPPAEPKAGDQTPATAPQEATIEDPVFYGHLSKLTDGGIKSEEDLVGVLNHYNELLEQAEQGFKPKYKDERTRMVHELLADLSGPEAAQTAMRTLRAVSFNPEGKSPKEVLFEAYLVDPKNSDLTPDKAHEYFQAEYEQKYADLEGNLVKERALANEVKDATKLISEVSKSFKAAEEQPQQQARQISEEVERNIQSAVDNFGGIRLAFTETPQESDFLNMVIENPQELETLKQDALNPQQWWNNFMAEFQTEKGFDYPSFVREFHEMRNHQKKAQMAYAHGLKLGQLAKVNEARNASDPKNPSQVPQPPVVAKKKANSPAEAWAQAKGIEV